MLTTALFHWPCVTILIAVVLSRYRTCTIVCSVPHITQVITHISVFQSLPPYVLPYYVANVFTHTSPIAFVRCNVETVLLSNDPNQQIFGNKSLPSPPFLFHKFYKLAYSPTICTTHWFHTITEIPSTYSTNLYHTSFTVYTTCNPQIPTRYSLLDRVRHTVLYSPLQYHLPRLSIILDSETPSPFPHRLHPPVSHIHLDSNENPSNQVTPVTCPYYVLQCTVYPNYPYPHLNFSWQNSQNSSPLSVFLLCTLSPTNNASYTSITSSSH